MIVIKKFFSILAMLIFMSTVSNDACLAEVISISDADFILPTALIIIEDEAFMGVDATVIFLHDKAMAIGEKAFAECPSLLKIRIPASVTAIADNAFDNCPTSLTIYGAKGSEAQRFAERKGLHFHDENDGDILLPEI